MKNPPTFLVFNRRSIEESLSKSEITEEDKSGNKWVFVLTDSSAGFIHYFTYGGNHERALEALKEFYEENRKDYSSYELQSLDHWFNSNHVPMTY